MSGRTNILLPFNSRPHEEVDGKRSWAAGPQQSFNSRPHEEVDSSGNLLPSGTPHLSIHDLTRRSTAAVDSISINLDLSIHDLTRRST